MSANILVVEDEAHLAQGLLFNLREEGYTVQLAVDGETALEMIAAESFDAVILDVMLPGRDGFSVVAELRAQQNFVPILMLTARGRPEDELNGRGAGADDYLPKPFDLAILLAAQRPAAAYGMAGSAAIARERVAFDFQLCRAQHRLFLARTHDAEQGRPAYADGERPAPLPGAEPGPHHFQKRTTGTGVARTRGHGHARHRQLYRSSAPLY
jgi:DNA-binding response OmpR family regulator